MPAAAYQRRLSCYPHLAAGQAAAPGQGQAAAKCRAAPAAVHDVVPAPSALPHMRALQVRLAVFSQHHVDGLDLALTPLQYMAKTFPQVGVCGVQLQRSALTAARTLRTIGQDGVPACLCCQTVCGPALGCHFPLHPFSDQLSTPPTHTPTDHLQAGQG